MKMKVLTVVWVLVAAFAVGATSLSAAEMTLTGKVGDAMCGMKHMVDNDAACTRGCVKKGSDYALIVKDQVYTLKASKDDLEATLDGLAGQQATVKGEVNGKTIHVASIVAAK